MSESKKKKGLTGKQILIIAIAVVVIAAAVWAVLALTGKKEEEKGMLLHEGVLSVGSEIGYPPFEVFAEDGVTPIGYDVDLVMAIAEKLGLEVNYVNTAWDGIFQGIGVNYDVVVSAVTITEDRKETMLFSDPYINNFQAVVVKADYEGEITGFLDLDGKVIAVQKETTSDILMSDYVDTGSISCTISANDKIATCFTQLKNGEVDIVVCDSTVADGYLAAEPDAYKIAYLDESEPEQFAIAIGLTNVELQTAVNGAIAALSEEGFFEENFAFWFGE
jgi:ABC-type amino acid transport substrate-binding protein